MRRTVVEDRRAARGEPGVELSTNGYGTGFRSINQFFSRSKSASGIDFGVAPSPIAELRTTSFRSVFKPSQ